MMRRAFASMAALLVLAARSSFAAEAPKEEGPAEPEIVTLSDEPEPDPQALAIGLQAGGGVFRTQGSVDSIVPAADFSFTFDVGLGPGGARVPWSIEPYAAFAVTRATLSSSVNTFPDRFTEIGARLVWRGEGSLDGHWLSFGAGLVWTVWGRCDHTPDQTVDPMTGVIPCIGRNDLSPAALVDVGVGVREWKSRFARYGILLRAPFELSSHWGFGAIAAFYAQVGFTR